MRSYRTYLLVLTCFISFGACQVDAQPAKESVTLFIVRHAEKADDGTDDPPLAAAGQARAALLAHTLRDAGIDAVYATGYRRTQGTAAPLAEALGVPITTYTVQGEVLADTLLTHHRGQEVLVVGHSNTVPLLLNALVGTEQFELLDEQAYDGLFIVTIRGRGDAEVIVLRFGE